MLVLERGIGIRLHSLVVRILVLSARAGPHSCVELDSCPGHVQGPPLGAADAMLSALAPARSCGAAARRPVVPCTSKLN